MKVAVGLLAVVLCGCSSTPERGAPSVFFENSFGNFSKEVGELARTRPEAQGCLSSISYFERSRVADKIFIDSRPNKILFMSAGAAYLDVTFVQIAYDSNSFSVVVGNAEGIDTKSERTLQPDVAAAIERAKNGLSSAVNSRSRTLGTDQCLYVGLLDERGARSFVSTHDLIASEASPPDAASAIRAVDELLDRLFPSNRQ